MSDKDARDMTFDFNQAIYDLKSLQIARMGSLPKLPAIG